MNRLLFFLPLIFLSSCNDESKNSLLQVPKDEMIVPEGKKEMILLTDRAPNFETPLKYFLLDFTPNDVFFVRWHLAGLPSKVDEETFRLEVSGNVKRELSLSLNDLKTKFKSVSVNAVCVCAGNSRSYFNPRVPGAQWKNGAMGNARWTGVPLKDILQEAGAKGSSFDVSFNGMDEPPLPSVPDFVKSLRMADAMNGEGLVAYEMNGEPLPLLNGYPLKLVVPGCYATYWVGMLNEIKVYVDTFKGFWMDKAYLIPKNTTNGNENPDSLSKKMTPINKIDVRSVFVSPENESVIKANTPCTIQGLALDGGSGIEKVELSIDSGKTWNNCVLNPSLGNYSWRRWSYTFIPETRNYSLQVKATNTKGDSQPVHQWNRSGYMHNEIETLFLKAKVE